MIAYDDEITVRRAPSPGIAAVLSVLIPGLGQVYAGRLLAGGLWFLATGFASFGRTRAIFLSAMRGV